MTIALLTTGDRKMATARMWFYEMSDMLRGLGQTVSVNALDLPRYDVAVVHWCTPEAIAKVLAHSPSCRIGVMNPGFGPPPEVRDNIDFMIVGSFLWEEILLPFGRRVYQHFDFPPEAERPRKVHANGPGPLVLGYCGNPIHYENDLFPHAAEGIARLARERNVLFRVVTNKAAAKPVIPGVRTELIEWELETHEEYTASFDIGVCPSFRDLAQLTEPFTFVRNGNRVQTLLWRSIPSVASPLPESCQTFQHGEHVFYAHTSHGWHHHLRTLADRPELRQTIGDRGRALVNEKFNRKQAAEAYLQIMLEELRQPAFAKNPAGLRAPRT